MAYISKIILPSGSEYFFKDKELHYYGECSTLAAATTKEVTISNFSLVNGVRIVVKFNNGNSAAEPELSINGAAAIPFYLTCDNVALWDAGETCEFVYDGSYWNLINYGKIEVIRL